MEDGDRASPAVPNPPEPAQADDIGCHRHHADGDAEDRAHTRCDSQKRCGERQHDVGQGAADSGHQHRQAEGPLSPHERGGRYVGVRKVGYRATGLMIVTTQVVGQVTGGEPDTRTRYSRGTKLLYDVAMSAPQTGVDAAAGCQLLVPATLDEAAPIEYQNLIGVGHRLETVGDHYHCPVPTFFCYGGEHLPLGFDVQLRRGLVENENARLSEKSAGDGDSLALTSAQGLSKLTDVRRQAMLQGLHPGAESSSSESLPHLFVCGVGLGESEIVADSAEDSIQSCLSKIGLSYQGRVVRLLEGGR